MPSPASTEPKFEFLRGVLGTFGKTGVPRLILIRRAVVAACGIGFP